MNSILAVFLCALILLIIVRFSRNPIISILLGILILAIKIPFAILAHVKSLFFKNKRIPPNLSQRLFTVFALTLTSRIPISLPRKIFALGDEKRIQQKHWVKKLDASNEHDGWEGFLIANGADQSEIGKDADMIILYAHGGGFVAGSALAFLDMFTYWIKTWKLSHGANTQILTLEYKLSPESSFPVARDNMLACYNWLVTEKKISPSKIAFAGDSSGGNLVAVSAIYLVNNPDVYSIDPPASLILISPLLSALTNSQSFIDNASYDTIDPVFLRHAIDLYIGNSNLHLTSPLISPLFEDQLSGLPKVWACVGGYEVLLDDTKAFIEKLVQNNVKAELVIDEANFHPYSTSKSASRNGAYESSIKKMGKFLYGGKN